MYATYSTPTLFVAEIERSIRWYQLLGFRLIDDDGCQPIGWARMHCEGGMVMFLRAERPIDPEAQRIALYMYSPELAKLREHLVQSGVEASEIHYPEYMKGGEMTLRDPDRFYIFVGHWGKEEQEAWEKRLAERAKKS